MEITLAVPADLDDVLDILNESARWLTSRGINQWIDGFPRELIAGNISRGQVYVARLDRHAVGTFTLQWSDEMFWPGATDEAGYIQIALVFSIPAAARSRHPVLFPNPVSS